MNRKKPMKAITMIQLGLAGVLIIVLALLVFWYSDGLSSYSPNALTYQCYGGSTFNYTEDATFREHENEITVSDSNGKKDLLEVPLLYKGRQDITLSENMLLMVPSEDDGVKRINRFTTVSESSGRITYSSGKKSAQSYGGFLYDGNDLYIFLEDTILNIAGTEIELPPLSYARVVYGQSVEYHNSETDENELVYVDESDVTANCKSGFELNLGTDIIYNGNEECLLFSSVDNANVIEME